MNLQEILTLVGANTAAVTFLAGMGMWLLRPHFNRAVLRALKEERGAWRDLSKEVFADHYQTVAEAKHASDTLAQLVREVSIELKAVGQTLGSMTRTIEELSRELRRNSEAVAKIEGRDGAE